MDAPLDDDLLTTRAARWFQASPAELVGLVVLVLGAVVVSGLLWFQATQRPSDLHSDAGSVGVPIGPEQGADGPAPGTDPTVDDHDHEHEHGPDADGWSDVATSGAATGDAPPPGGTGSDGPDAPARPVPQPASEVAVHVTGAVATPGLVVLPDGGRVADAVTAAGGLTDDAVTELINLARVLVDGEHVHVPVDGEELPPLAAAPPSGSGGPADPNGAQGGAPGGAPGGDPAGGAATGAPSPIDINHASAADLESLPGIGPARAQAIVSYREEHGPFASPGDLRAVSGIGEAIFQGLADLVTAG